jgi:hypothetical protein
MPWKEPHLRRLPTVAEYIENKQRIQELDAIIETLTIQLNAVQTERNNRCSFIAPFRYLPPNILAEIASECVALQVSCLTLSHVCKSLREVVVDMSFLWNKILLREERHSNDPWKYRLSTIDLFLRRGFQGYIQCKNLEHLELLLHRAKELPLVLAIENPPTSRSEIRVNQVRGIHRNPIPRGGAESSTSPCTNWPARPHRRYHFKYLSLLDS